MKMDIYIRVLCHKFCLLIQLLSFLVFALGHLASPRRQQEVLHAFIPVFRNPSAAEVLLQRLSVNSFFWSCVGLPTMTTGKSNSHAE